MNKEQLTNPVIPGHILILLLIPILFIGFSCRTSRYHKPETYESTISCKQVISWNVMFAPGTASVSRDKIITEIQDYVNDYYVNYNSAHGKDYMPQFNVACCPCDTLLCNIDFSPVDGTGQSVTSPPPVKPHGPGGSGDFLAATVSNNNPIDEPVIEGPDSLKYHVGFVQVRNIPVDPSKILAIIDSGIDTTLFSDGVSRLIWKDRFAPTLYNFIPSQFGLGFNDDTRERHGSAVTGVAIKAMDSTFAYPGIMVLKALDSNNHGSIFSVSCALSYARQKNATLINLSLGYYGEADLILRHYLELCDAPGNPIDVFVAAGNTKHPHNKTQLCDHAPNGNYLSGWHLFYPACFSRDFKNITSVTQMSGMGYPCFYQNYSNHYISLGVYDPFNCCAIQVDFMKNIISYYEGSSFATPVASGLKMATILNGGGWDALLKIDTHKKVSINGTYVQYSSTR